MASGIEKNLPTATSEYLGQDITHMWLASAFGYPVRNLLTDPPEVLTEPGWRRLVGEMRRVAWDAASEVFGASTELDRNDPSVTTERLLAHAGRPDGPETMRGDLETLRGWDFGKFYAPPGDPVYWKPGSVSDGMQTRWTIQDSSLWKCEL